ncbi:multicopper oxidase domain-containing protein [Cutibacterium sp. WCA-380-WT-3A]|uniref:Multicopper oxidase domain-containing protein n=1 Tax=Cutibacterium porci TaxID=2605781 RepID=A0A7K0J4A0_9ACTN|nr:multicopper oxidase domain-containing protein [Cutibacterium porci]MSS44759.1 multicopper oxidase domain-containing protein [Cutibacterium porci]
MPEIMRASHTPDTNRRSWHRKASRPVSGWLAALLIVAIVSPWIPQSRWLLIHMVTLGVATTSIMVWGQYFTEAILHNNLTDADRRRQVLRIRLLTVGIVVACVGMVATWPWVSVVGAAVVGSTLTWYAFALAHQVRHALPGRFTSTVWFYCAAASLLPLGATLGAIMTFSPTEPWRTRLLVTHQALNLLGFVGLTVVGTLITLWPTVLRTKMQPSQDRHGRVALGVMLIAVVVTSIGALCGLWWLAALGVTTHIAGVCIVLGDLVACAARKPPRDFPGFTMAAAMCWMLVWLVWLVWKLATTGTRLLADDIFTLSVPVIVGFLLQLLIGAMSYLMPMVMGGGPKIVRATNAKMHAYGALRATITNAGLLLWVLAVGMWTRRIGMAMAIVGLATFLPATAAMVRTGIPMLKEKGMAIRQAPPMKAEAPDSGEKTTQPPDRSAVAGTTENAVEPAATTPPDRRSFVGAFAGLATALTAAAVGHRLDASAPTDGSPTAGNVAPTGHTTRVAITAEGMKYHPNTITVPAGDRLVVGITNKDPNQVHDLQFANGAHSPRLAPGAHATVNVGVVTRPTEGWCTIVGHKSMGMVLDVRVNGLPATSDPDRHTETASPRRKIDLTKAPGGEFTPRDAVLPPLLAGRAHTMTLTAEDAVQEVAPQTTINAMTYNGRYMAPVIHARIGDQMRVHLVNKSTMAHSLDFHAGTVSPDEVMRTIAPGQELDYNFTLHRAGIWLYHCSTAPMSAHIAAGMFGAVIVPPHDLPSADRQFYLVQSETYLSEYNGAEVDTAKIANETPDLTMFNGHANQYVFEPLKAKVGERVRIWVLAAGPSRGCSFHVVGTQFDTVFKEGTYILKRGNPEGGGSQALDLASAQGGFVEMVFEEPGRYTFVNHSFVEMERGAKGFIEVTA